MMNNILSIDFSILNTIQEWRTPLTDKIFSFITHLGSGGIIWIALVLILMIRPKDRLCGFKIAAGLLLGLLIGTLIIKNIVMRERPFNTDGALINSGNMIIPPPSDRYSFPSGHTLSSFTSAFLAFTHSRLLGVTATITAALIAFSRMYLYVHFPTDILGAIILSVPVALLANMLVNKIAKTVSLRSPKK